MGCHRDPGVVHFCLTYISLKLINHGLSQGSRRGSLLFNIHISEIDQSWVVTGIQACSLLFNIHISEIDQSWVVTGIQGVVHFCLTYISLKLINHGLSQGSRRGSLLLTYISLKLINHGLSQGSRRGSLLFNIHIL